ncbi:MAG: hypothetical protein QOJ67_978 [Acidimicrobiaceae bacterium]|jgi:pimeloyl-ACP methyl ester carboxylesterase
MTGAGAVVLVHGAFVDGSRWQGVYRLLSKDGYSVSVVQNSTQSLEGDVAATRRVIDAQSEPVILVGHSYGGVVITEAGNDPNVAALVYIAAFAPDKGESVATLTDLRPGASVSPVLPPQDGFLLQDRAKFPAWFGADIPAEQAEFLADSQVPWQVDALGGTVSEPAWRTKPSWYLVAADDRRSPAGPAVDGGAGGCDRGRGRRQPRDLHLETGTSGSARRPGGFRGVGYALKPGRGPSPWHGASRCRRLRDATHLGCSNGD